MNEPSLFFDDYLDLPDFATALTVLAGDLYTKAQLPSKVDEIGLVCPNVLLAANYLEKKYKGMKIFFLGEGSPRMFKENRKDVPFTTRVGFGFYKGVIVELAEPGIGSNVFSQTEIVDNKIMINHLGFKARDNELSRKINGKTVSYAKIMSELGIPKAVEAEVYVLGFSAHIHIFETMHLTRKVEIEFLDFRLFNIKGPKVWYMAFIIGIIGWSQKTIGPRFFKMHADQWLPPAP